MRVPEGSRVIDADNMSLDEWLDLLASEKNENILFVDYMFPNDTCRDSYLETVCDREENEVKWLLRKFLIPSGSFSKDEITLSSLIDHIKQNPDKADKIKNLEFFRRLVISASQKGEGRIQPWEGITWALDLLPNYPRYAINALEAYFAAHVMFLPDGRITGLSDAIAIIRAKFIQSASPEEIFSKFSSREFEHLVESLYHAMGYQTILTKEVRDGGRDIIARQTELGKRETALIECKNWRKVVGVDRVRSLLGVVTDEKASRGVVVTSSRFTKPAKEFAQGNKSLELIDGDLLKVMLNEHCGTNWSIHANYLIMESIKRQTKPEGSTKYSD
ncbi:MAG: restriction system protein [Methanoculleus sp.]|nr:restriction system protein [Methanoculleus sp.]